MVMNSFNTSSEDSFSDATESISFSDISLDETFEHVNAGQLSKRIAERKFLICLLEHIKTYEKEFSLSRKIDIVNLYNSNFEESMSIIELLKSKIRNAREIYMINDWNNGKDNREKIINLISLLSDRANLIPLGNTVAYQLLKFVITTNCREQMDKTLAVAETIPNIDANWEAPLLAILSKFAYYESSELKIAVKHYKTIGLKKDDPISITRHISPLRENILNDFMIPEDKKLENFFLAMSPRKYSLCFSLSDYEELRKLLYLNLTNSIFINDDKWNSHIRTFVSENKIKICYGQSGFNIF